MAPYPCTPAVRMCSPAQGKAGRRRAGRLVGSGLIPYVSGFSQGLALSGDGNTALIGGQSEAGVGAIWEFRRTESAWSQVGEKEIPSGRGRRSRRRRSDRAVLRRHDGVGRRPSGRHPHRCGVGVHGIAVAGVRLGDRSHRHRGEAEVDRQSSERKSDRMPVRIRHHDLLRVDGLVLTLARIGDQPRGGVGEHRQPQREHRVSLPPVLLERQRRSADRRPDVHDARNECHGRNQRSPRNRRKPKTAASRCRGVVAPAPSRSAPTTAKTSAAGAFPEAGGPTSRCTAAKPRASLGSSTRTASSKGPTPWWWYNQETGWEPIPSSMRRSTHRHRRRACTGDRDRSHHAEHRPTVGSPARRRARGERRNGQVRGSPRRAATQKNNARRAPAPRARARANSNGMRHPSPAASR